MGGQSSALEAVFRPVQRARPWRRNRQAARNRDSTRGALSREPPAARAGPGQPAASQSLDAPRGADHSGAGWIPRGSPRSRGRDLRGRGPTPIDRACGGPAWRRCVGRARPARCDRDGSHHPCYRAGAIRRSLPARAGRRANGTCDTFDDYRHADVRFHLGVAQATGSPRLVAAMTEVHGDICDVIAPIAHPVERLSRANDQHRSLVGLLRQGDVAHASLLMREHVGETEHILTQNVVGSSNPPCRRETSRTGSTRPPRPL